MIPTTQVLRVLFVEPSARDVQLVGEILHETTTRLPGSYVFDVVRSNFGALERVSRSEYRLVCVAEDSKSALHGRMAAKLLRRSCPDLSVTLVLDGKAKEPPPPKATRTGAKSKRSSSSPSSSRSASPSSSTGSGIFQTSSLPRKSSSSSSSSSSSTLGKGCSSGGACWGPRPGAGGRGVGFCGGGGFAAGFWPDGGVAAGGGSSGGGNVECEGVAGGTGGEVAGGRQREERIAGGGGGAGGGRERGPSSSSPSLSIPSSSPRPRLTSSLETDLEVVDYVLKRPFSDETFRLLLEATESDHRREPGALEEAENTALLASPSLASALLGEHDDDDELQEEGRWNASAEATWEGSSAAGAKASAASHRRRRRGGGGGSDSSTPDPLELDPGWWLSQRSAHQAASGGVFGQAAETAGDIARGPRVPDSPERALLPPPPERPASPRDPAHQQGEQEPRRRQRRRPRPHEEQQPPRRQRQQDERGHEDQQQPQPEHRRHQQPRPSQQPQHQPYLYGPVPQPPPPAQFPGSAAFAAAARAGLHPGVPMMLRNHNFPLHDPHCQPPFGVYPSAQQFALSMQGMMAAGCPQQLHDRYPVFPQMQQQLPPYLGQLSHNHHNAQPSHHRDHVAKGPPHVSPLGFRSPGFLPSNTPPIAPAQPWQLQSPSPYPPPGTSAAPPQGSGRPTPESAAVEGVASVVAAPAAPPPTTAAAPALPSVPSVPTTPTTAPSATAPAGPAGKRARVDGPVSASAIPSIVTETTSRTRDPNLSEELAIGRGCDTAKDAAAVGGAPSMGAVAAIRSVPSIAMAAGGAVAAAGARVLTLPAAAASPAGTLVTTGSPRSGEKEAPRNLEDDGKMASSSSSAAPPAQSNSSSVANPVCGLGTTLGGQRGTAFEARPSSGTPLLPTSFRDAGESGAGEKEQTSAARPASTAWNSTGNRSQIPSPTGVNHGGGAGDESTGGGAKGTAFQRLRPPLPATHRVGVAGGRERGAAALLPLSKPRASPQQQQQQQRGASGEVRPTPAAAAVCAAAEIATLTGSPGLPGFGPEDRKFSPPTAMRSNLQDHPSSEASGCEATVVRLPPTPPERSTV